MCVSGTGGESIYNGGGPFPDENFIRDHDRPGETSPKTSGQCREQTATDTGVALQQGYCQWQTQVQAQTSRSSSLRCVLMRLGVLSED